MARPARSLIMARRAAAALLAAVEMGNKTVIPYREETFSLQLLNSWETLLKARIVQQNRNRLEAIYKKESNKRFVRDPHTKSPYTIKFVEALNRAGVPQNVKINLLGVNAMRNDVAHLGTLSVELRNHVLRYGTASVVNFAKLYQEWFGEQVAIPYLLPIAFVGKSQILLAGKKGDFRQRQLLNYLSQLVRSTDTKDTSYAVTLQVDVSVNPVAGGGGTIGVTSDQNAPQMSVSDDQIVYDYPWTYNDLTSECKKRYADFKENQSFHVFMRRLKQSGECAHKRNLDPNNARSPSQWRYNPVPMYRPRFLGHITRTKLKLPAARRSVVAPEPEDRIPDAQSTSAGCREHETLPVPEPVPAPTGSAGPTAVAP